MRNVEVIIEDIPQVIKMKSFIWLIFLFQVFINFSFINHRLIIGKDVPNIIWFSLIFSALSIANSMSKFDALNLSYVNFPSKKWLIRRCFRGSEAFGNVAILGLLHLATEENFGVFIFIFALFLTVFFIQFSFSTLPFSHIIIKSWLWIVKIPSFTSKVNTS